MNNIQVMPGRSDDRARAKCFHPTGLFIDFSRDEIHQSIPQRFEKIVRQFPDRTAVESAKHRLTYRRLNSLANQAAHAMLSACVDSPSVAVLMEQDAAVVGAMLAVLKAGKFYVPLDPSLPHDRARLILEDADAEFIITNTEHLALANSFAKPLRQLINIDDMDGWPESDPSTHAQPDDLCWVVYTSGSTGRPKGVMQTHRNVLQFVMNYTNALQICAEDRLTLLFSFSVNGGNHDIFTALFNGAAVCPYDLKTEGFAGLGRWLIDKRITIYHSVPTVFRQFTENLGNEAFPDIRVVRLGGEPAYRRDVNMFKKHFPPECILVNRLGSSETGSLRMFFLDHETDIAGNLLPVGYAVSDNEIIFLDDSGAPACSGEGEIAVRTRYISPGYWKRPELTAQSFFDDPSDPKTRVYRTGDLGRMLPDGCLLHLGRKDFFVKIRGYQVELDEVELALREVPGIKDAVATVTNNNSGDERLIGYIVPQQIPGPNASEIRRFLASKLPDYMIPAAFVELEALPLTDTLKIDRKALPKPNGSRADISVAYAPPRNYLEDVLSKIWAEILEIDRVGVHDKFFDLGGHSLSATRIISRVISQFGVELSVKALFESPTVADMAKVVALLQQRQDR